MNWSYAGGTDPNYLRRIMSNFSLYVRTRQYFLFVKYIKPQAAEKIIDVGTSPDERLIDTNFFENKYPYKQMLSIASIEECGNLVVKYKLNKFLKIKANARLPLKDKSYDIVVSWATLEHVGSRSNQKFFISELARIGKRVFITTPDRLSFYEPHTATFFLHFLPPAVFRKLLKIIGKDYWSQEINLNILSYDIISKMIKGTGLKLERFKLFGLFPSHLIIYG